DCRDANAGTPQRGIGVAKTKIAAGQPLPPHPSRHRENEDRGWTAAPTRVRSGLYRLEVAEEVGLRVDHQRRVLAERLIALERLEERVELRVRAVRLAVDPRRLRVRLTDDLLRAPLGLRADPPQLALHVAQDLLAAALSLRAEPRGDRLALRDHAALDLRRDRVDVVDP